MRDTVVRAERDWVHRRVGLLLWGPPSVVILASALGAVAPARRSVGRCLRQLTSR